MARQVQLRRGTTAENDNFIGAAGELTFDTSTGGVRVHNGSRQGGNILDSVVAYQLPTSANGYTWYRKYASGWVEQGGQISASTYSNATTSTVTLPVSMSTARYTIKLQKLDFDSAGVSPQVGARTATNFTWSVTYTRVLARTICWEVAGLAA